MALSAVSRSVVKRVLAIETLEVRKRVAALNNSTYSQRSEHLLGGRSYCEAKYWFNEFEEPHTLPPA